MFRQPIASNLRLSGLPLRQARFNVRDLRAATCSFVLYTLRGTNSSKPCLLSDCLSRQRNFTTGHALNGKPRQRQSKSPASNPANSPKESSQAANENLTLPSVSLEGLGLGKSMKRFLFVCLCIFATMETWFWCKAAWIWWKGEQVGTSAENE